MNYKALALGAVIGFAAALTPACGGSSCDTCTSNGTCVSAVSATQCGSNGDTCVACAGGDSCIGGKCVAPTTDGGATCSNCPTGCCANGLCLGGSSTNNCGSGGAACVACGPSESCGSPTTGAPKTCFIKPVPDAGVQVGDPCTDNAHCSMDLGGTATCKTGSDAPANDGGFAFQTPFCSAPCNGSTACPGDSTCLPNTFAVDGGTIKSLVGFGGSPNVDGSCFKTCDLMAATDPCGAGFSCQPAGSGAGACLPLTPMPTGIAGQPCLNNPELCTAPPSSGFCAPDTVGFTGGACLADCTNDTKGDICASDSLCVGFSQTQALCVETCNDPGQRSNCRTNYSCATLTKSDGTTLPQGACLPDCLQTQGGWNMCPTGKTCNATTGQCQ